ncbi:hypothetical protein IQ249_12895 [Lusitaniella coriacea LEGE 07157]|uniref:Uncharacterized protein n=1 Tax=Lusitaniella coriacea LEGE 07157 TaxID=945747 RepID=A0A8J7DWZ0_9CYAN|nr:hypothetical protein [Lusitaniella coriacea]MBE9116797.1 hypothetical protein [Lusitaniella coriacea LEGE 07157]
MTQPQTQNQTAEEDIPFIPTYPLKSSPPLQTKRFGMRALKGLLWVGLPIAVVTIANLPHPTVRRSVAQTAPILLLPSYISIERNYRGAIASANQAEQFLQNAKTLEDLDLGQQQLRKAQQHAAALPIWFLEEFPEAKWGNSNWQWHPVALNHSLVTIKRLKTRLSREREATTQLRQLEQGIHGLKWDYIQSSTQTDKKRAIADWKTALDKLGKIPRQTLAGKTAQAQQTLYEREFQQHTQKTQAITGTLEHRQQSKTLIEGAWQFAWQAALASQNPPHSAAQWQQIEVLWERAISLLESITPDDLEGYSRAQQFLAKYNANLGQIRVRRQAEQESVEMLEQAQRQMERWLGISPNEFHSQRAEAQRQGIIHTLEKVQPGTTAYPKARKMRISIDANNQNIPSTSPKMDNKIAPKR